MPGFAVNLWDADIVGNGEQTGPRWTKYVDDPEQGALTHTIIDSGPVPSALVEAYASEDEWLYGVEADAFLALVAVPHLRELARQGGNILWSAENGGYNGRPSEVKRILGELVEAIGVEG